MVRSDVYAKRRYAVASLILAGVLGLAACGASEPETAERAPWQETARFAVSGQVEEEQGLWVEEYIPVTHGAQ